MAGGHQCSHERMRVHACSGAQDVIKNYEFRLMILGIEGFIYNLCNVVNRDKSMTEMKMTRVNMKLVQEFVKKHPDLKPILEAERGLQTLVSIMLRKALEEAE